MGIGARYRTPLGPIRLDLAFRLPVGGPQEVRQEDPRDAALREVAEETGVRARLMRPLPIIEFEVNGKPVRAKFYLMELIFEGTSIEKKVERQTDWLSFDEAMAARLPKEAKKLVVVAERHALALNLQGN